MVFVPHDLRSWGHVRDVPRLRGECDRILSCGFFSFNPQPQARTVPSRTRLEQPAACEPTLVARVRTNRRRRPVAQTKPAVDARETRWPAVISSSASRAGDEAQCRRCCTAWSSSPAGAGQGRPRLRLRVKRGVAVPLRSPPPVSRSQEYRGKMGAGREGACGAPGGRGRGAGSGVSRVARRHPLYQEDRGVRVRRGERERCGGGERGKLGGE
jgi:hypothetical protein